MKRVVLHLQILPNATFLLLSSVPLQANAISCDLHGYYLHTVKIKPKISIMTRASYSESLHMCFLTSVCVDFLWFLRFTVLCFYELAGLANRHHSSLQFSSFNYVRSDVHESHGSFD